MTAPVPSQQAARLEELWKRIAGILASARKRYRQWRERTVMQTEGVLDRLEKGEDMRPAPPPWIRRLQMKFGQL